MNRFTRHIQVTFFLMISLASSMPNGKEDVAQRNQNSPLITMGIQYFVPKISGQVKKYYLQRAENDHWSGALTGQSRQKVSSAFPVSLFGMGLVIAVSLGWIRRKSEDDTQLAAPIPQR
jgi:hypothetical protein